MVRSQSILEIYSSGYGKKIQKLTNIVCWTTASGGGANITQKEKTFSRHFQNYLFVSNTKNIFFNKKERKENRGRELMRLGR